MDDKIIFGKGENLVYLLPEMANRHGLIAGATGRRDVFRRNGP
jgi:hypothetical protein